MNWGLSLFVIGLMFLAVNLAFACAYYLTGGIAGANPTSFLDSLSFSVQTLATIGYGVMHPQSHTATTVMIVESAVGIVFTALATGLVFAKFSRATARVGFTSQAVITQHDGKPTLMFRVGNQRSNMIVEAQIKVSAGLIRVTSEGDTFYRMYDLKLARDRQGGMRRGWTVMHFIDESSPLYGLDAAGLEKSECELEIALTGLDDVTMQTVYAIKYYTDKDIRFDHKFKDTLKTLPNGDLLVDLRNFDVIVPAPPTPRDSVAA
jgi:inward rectifier potassium channel